MKTIDCPMCRAPSRISSKLILDVKINVKIKSEENQGLKTLAARVESLEKENRALKQIEAKNKLSYNLWRPKVKNWIAAQTQALKMQNSDLNKINNNLKRKNIDQTLQIKNLKSTQKADRKIELKILQKQVMRCDKLAIKAQATANAAKAEASRLGHLLENDQNHQI